jgi:hypothetical protein
MKWYEDLFAWMAILLVMVAIAFFGFVLGEKNVITHCNTYGAYKISEEEAMLCVVKPLLKNNSGEMSYIPAAKEMVKKGKMT